MDQDTNLIALWEAKMPVTVWDWEEQRKNITRLYTEENYTIEKLRLHMIKEHNFKGT
jgi:hypothetical protein